MPHSRPSGLPLLSVRLHIQRTRLRAGAALLCSALLLAACGGGGNGVPAPSPTAAPTVPPPALPNPPAQSNSSSIAVSSAAPATATLPTTGGITPTVTIPRLASGAGNLAVTLASGGDATMSRVHSMSAVRPQAMPGGAYLLQIDFVPSADMALSGAPSFSLDLTQWITSAGLSVSQAAAYLQSTNVYAGIVDNSGNFNVVGPLTINATSTALTVSYAGPAMTLTLQANQHYTIGIHLGPIAAPTATPTPTPAPTATPTPTPAPTATPTPTPAPTAAPLALNPTTLAIAGTGSTNAQSFTVSGGTGSYAASGYDAAVISVQQDPSNASRFIVTGVAAGSTSITVSDSGNQSISLPVTVTTASGVIQ